MIVAELVDGCPVNCAACWNRNRHGTYRQMSLATVEQVLERYGQSRIDWFNWGEPLWHDEFHEIAARVKGTASRVSSNFSLQVSDERLRDLDSFQRVYVSLSGLTPETYRIYHRGGCFPLVEKNLERLIAHRQRGVVIRWIAHERNAHEETACRERCQRWGVEFERVAMNGEVEDLLANVAYDVAPVGEVKHPGLRECRLLRWIVIGVDGQYLLCCGSHNVPTGLTLDDPVTPEELMAAKRALPLCRACHARELWRRF